MLQNKTTMKKLIALAIVLVSLNAKSQDVRLQLTTEKVLLLASEVYGNTWTENNPTLITAFESSLNQRVYFKEITLTSEDKYPRLSSFAPMNKVNSSISNFNGQSFSFESFNPLKYQVNYFSNQLQVIRLDNTNWVMIIEPQQ